jgi:RNA polymerase sigma-70 factor (ECF subfamily)
LRLLGRLFEEGRNRPADDAAASRGDDVRDAIERLRPLDREVLRLVMWEGLSHGEAASVLDCSVNAVAQRLHNARERLRVELGRPAEQAPEMTRRSESYES